MGNASRGTNGGALCAAQAIHSARAKLAALFGCPRPDHVVFTCNSTEALNMAISGLFQPGDHILSTDLEHNSVLRPLYRLEDEGLAEVSFVPADRLGRIDCGGFERLIRPETRAIVCTHASNLTGNLVDLARVGEIARRHGLLLVADVSQTAGCVPIDMPTFYAMLASVSLFGILLGTVRAPAPNRAATTFCVLLFAIPFLMIDVSFRADLLTICSTVTFCILSSQCKTPEAVSLDVTNSVCFCVLSCMSSWIFSCRSIGQLADQVFIEKERDTDGLTRLLTKSASKVLISTYLGQGTPGSLLIVDIDDFKSVNDRFGHLYGDEVLRRFAQCLHENVQRPDILGRFGGDEFIVFLIGADASDASATAWCITQAVASCFRGSRCPITCSIGTATVERSHQDYEELFQAADQALYNAKDCGKNQVKVNY